MKVLLINKFHYEKDGATRCYFNTAEVLEKNGHEVAFFSMEHPKNLKSKWSKYFVKEVDYSKNHSLIEKIKLSSKILYNFEANRKLQSLIDEFKPDIAHLHVIYHQLSPSIIHTLKKNNIPVVMTLHDYKTISPNYSLMLNGKIWEKSKSKKYCKCVTDKCVKNSYFKSLVCAIESVLHDILKSYQKVDAYVSPSKFLIEKFREFEFKNKITHIRNPLHQVTRNDYETKKQILYYGRLSEEKGVSDLIKAFSKIRADYNLLIAGDGPDREKLEELNSSNEVKFLGHLTGDGLSRVIGESEIVVMPSKWYENAPYSAVEPMSIGKIMIASNLGGLPELIENGKTGFLFEAGNVRELSIILEKAINMTMNEKLEMGDRAIKFVQRNFNLDLYYQEILGIYGKVIND